MLIVFCGKKKNLNIILYDKPSANKLKNAVMAVVLESETSPGISGVMMTKLLVLISRN